MPSAKRQVPNAKCLIPMKHFIIVAYDIKDDKRRLKIAKTLEEYGERANYSVFECFLTEPQIRKMQKRLERLYDSKTDSILYYYLCKNCIMKRSGLGKLPEVLPEIVTI